MSKLLHAIFFISICSLLSCSMRDPYSEAFRNKIIKSFASVKEFVFIGQNKIIYPDTAFDLPPPEYKAMVVDGEAPNDSIFFYYYLRKEIQSVFQFQLTKDNFTVGSNLLDCGDMLVDSATGNFLLYFRNCPPMDEMVLVRGEATRLDSLLSINFGFISPKITLEEVKQEKEYPEPPPPPPPPKPKNKKAAQ